MKAALLVLHQDRLPLLYLFSFFVCGGGDSICIIIVINKGSITSYSYSGNSNLLFSVGIIFIIIINSNTSGSSGIGLLFSVSRVLLLLLLLIEGPSCWSLCLALWEFSVNSQDFGISSVPVNCLQYFGGGGIPKPIFGSKTYFNVVSSVPLLNQL